MATIYIILKEQGHDIERAVLIAAHREATKIVFIGQDDLACKAAANFGVAYEVLPANASVPLGELRVFSGQLVRAH